MQNKGVTPKDINGADIVQVLAGADVSRIRIAKPAGVWSYRCMTIPAPMPPYPSKALFLGALLLMYAGAASLVWTATAGYTPFQPRAAATAPFGSISDRIPISDVDFEQLINRHFGSGEFAMNSAQEASLIERYKRRDRDLSNNDYLSLLREDSSMSKAQILCALMEYTYRNNATPLPLRPLASTEVEALMAETLDQTSARLIFESALQAERKGEMKIAKERFKFLMECEYIRQCEPAMYLVAGGEFNAIE